MQYSIAIAQLENAEALQMGMPLFYEEVINFCFDYLKIYHHSHVFVITMLSSELGVVLSCASACFTVVLVT